MENTQFVISQSELAEHGMPETIIGRKALSLIPAISEELPVPPFFVISTTVFNTFIRNIIDKSDIKNFELFANKIIETPFTQNIKNAIKKEYAKLNIIGKSWVAVRSSISAPLYPQLSFSGLLDTYLNVHGVDEAIEATKRVYASLFSPSMLAYIKENKVKIKNISLAVIIQRMVASEISGITFSYNPITEQQDQIVTQAVFGLGDVINTGEINPDVYISDKATLKLIEKKLYPQFWLETRDYDEQHETFHNKRIELSPVWQFSQKLTEEQIESLANLIVLLQPKIPGRFLVEWTITNNKIYILQIKPIDTPINKITKPNVEAKIGKKESETIQPKASKPQSNFQFLANKPISKEPLPILSGIPLVRGRVKGKVYIVTKTMWEHEKTEVLSNIAKRKKLIFVTDFFSSELEILLSKAKGIIADTGGPNSDLALLIKEQNIPTITQTRIGSKLLQTGDKIILDASAGTVYPYKKDTIAQEEQEGNKTSIKISKSKKNKNSLRYLEIPEKIKTKINTPVTVFTPQLDWPLLWLYNFHEHKKSFFKKLPEYQQILVELTDQKASKIASIFKMLKLKAQEYLIIAIRHKDKQHFLKIKRQLADLEIRRSSLVKFVPIITKPIQIIKLSDYPLHFLDGFILDLPALYTALGGIEEYLKDPEFIEFLSPSLQKIKEEKLTIIGAMLNTPLSSKHLKFVRLGVNTFITKERISTPTKTIKLLTKLSKGALI